LEVELELELELEMEVGLEVELVLAVAPEREGVLFVVLELWWEVVSEAG
jgi:hypothetical protein